jgi:hypothetical protein
MFVNIIEHTLSILFDPIWWLKYLHLRLKVRNLRRETDVLKATNIELSREALDLTRKLDDLRVFNATRRDVGKDASDGRDHDGLISLENVKSGGTGQQMEGEGS